MLFLKIIKRQNKFNRQQFKAWVNMRSIVTRFIHQNRFLNKIIPFNLADIGEGITEVQIIQWFVKEGDKVKQFDKVAEVQSDKAAVEITSRFDGIIKKRHYDTAAIAKVGLPLVDIEVDDSSSSESTKGTEMTKETEMKVGCPIEIDETGVHLDVGKAMATPAVRNMAREMKVDLSVVKGTGKHGRILKEDLINLKSAHSTPAEPVNINPSEHSAQKSVPLSIFQKTMVRTMNESMKIPHFGYFDELSVDNLIKIRQQMNPMAKKDNVKLTFMAFFIKAASNALLKFPILNARISADSSSIIYQSDHNMGIAMDTPQGLVVPVIKRVQTLSLKEIASQLSSLQQKGLNGQLTKDNLSGATFSISNIGSIGGTYATPIIVSPQVCIGAIGTIQKHPRFDENGNVFASSIMQISWSADHRIIDGATMARFSNLWKSFCENPSLMLY